jgi:hypothetical protein
MSAFVPPLERLQYVDGQVLAARDLSATQENNERLRAFHNRYLHQTWGVAAGLATAASSNSRAVVVQAGYAIDAYGQSIFVSSETTVDLPLSAQSQVMALALSAPGTLEWWLPQDLTPGTQVLLCAAFVTNGLISGDLDTSVRRSVTSFAAPRLATGSTVAGQTIWTDSPGDAQWVQTTVDTSAAGLVQSPQYFPTLQPAGNSVLVVSAGPLSFVARVVGSTSKDANAGSWTVSWVGIESEGLL